MAATIDKDSLLKLEYLDDLPKFLHDCVNDLFKPKTANLDTSPGGDTEWSNEELDKLQRKIQNIYRQSAMDENFSLPNGLPGNVKNALEIVYKIRHKDILNLLIKESLVNNGHNLMENIDWKLKWIMGSSKLATIREPVCQVELRCASAEKDLKIIKKNVNFEANLEKIDELIAMLNNVKNELDGL